MREIVIHNWDELQNAVFQDVWDAKIMRHRSNFIYRGTSEKEWGMLSSLGRVCAHDMSLEESVLRSFRKYGFADLAEYNSFWQIVAVAQHSGLPTRLLDWTYSPLVAAHFATEDIGMYDKDGAIWCVNVEAVNTLLPPRLKALLDEAHCQIFTIDMLDKIVRSFRELQSISDEPFALFFEPASAMDRIANQYALFSMVSDANVLLSDILKGCEGSFQKIIIPWRTKLEIRDKLDYINISERMIYPGLDGICKWITRHYSALGPKYNRREHIDNT